MDLGQVLRKVSLEIYLDVKYMIEEMKKQDRELRTSVMKLFVARTKVKLTQLYLMTRWLCGRNVIDFFNRINDTGSQMQLINNGLALKLDEMFFSHSAVYAMRTEQLRMSRASDCLIRGGLRNLPASIFLIGSSSFPVNEVTRITPLDLDLYINSKLLVDNSMINKTATLSVTVVDGVVRIHMPNFFEFFLTLQHLSLTSQWNLLGVRIMSHNIDSAGTESKPNFTQLEDALLAPCQRILGEDASWSRVVDLCHHTATGASLRLLHSSSVTAASSVWKAAIVIDWKSEDDCNTLVVQFWKSFFAREHLFVLKIKQKRVISSDSAILTSQLESKSLVYNVRNTKESGLVEGFEEKFQTQQFIDSGVSFEKLLKHCFSMCVEAKLQYIARRLHHSLNSLKVDRMYGVSLSSNAVKLTTIELKPEVGIILEVDVRTGRFLLDTTSESGCSLGEWKASIELFIAEINNVQSEQLFGSFLTRYFTTGSNSSDSYTPILSTLDVVLKYLSVNWWAHHITTSLWKSGVANSTISTGASIGGLLVEVTQWGKSDSVHRQCAQNYHKIFLKGSKLPNLQLHPDLIVPAASGGVSSKLSLELSYDVEGGAKLSVLSPAPLSGITPPRVVLDANSPEASCSQAAVLLEHALMAMHTTSKSAQPVHFNELPVGYLKHGSSTGVTLVVPHETHLYLIYDGSLRISQLNPRPSDISVAVNYCTLGEEQWSGHSSTCQLRLACYDLPVFSAKSIELEAFKLTDTCSDSWKSELFVQHLLHSTLHSYLSSASSTSDARTLTALTLQWWNCMQSFVDVLVHLLTQSFPRTATSNYNILPVHQSESGTGVFKVLLSVGEVDDVEAYFEVVLSNSRWGQADNKWTVSVRNVLTPASSVAVYSATDEVKKHISALISELHVEE